MKLEDLSYDQRFELAQKYLCEFGETEPSYEEMANADMHVTDKQLEETYGGIDFTDGDFDCTANPVEYSRDDLYCGINAILYAIKDYFERSKHHSGYNTTGDIPFLYPLSNEEFQALQDNDWHIELDGKCVYETGCGSYYEDAKEIPLNSVCIEHIPFILNSLSMYGN